MCVQPFPHFKIRNFHHDRTNLIGKQQSNNQTIIPCVVRYRPFFPSIIDAYHNHTIVWSVYIYTSLLLAPPFPLVMHLMGLVVNLPPYNSKRVSQLSVI